MVLCPLLTSWPIETESIPEPPRVSNKSFHPICLIYSPLVPYDIGRPDSWFSYPKRKALYPVSVRHIRFLSTASFRSPFARDTLACDYRIPVIMAPKGLEVISLAPIRLTTCPAHQECLRHGGLNTSCMAYLQECRSAAADSNTIHTYFLQEYRSSGAERQNSKTATRRHFVFEPQRGDILMAHFNQFLSIRYSIRYVVCHWHEGGIYWKLISKTRFHFFTIFLFS